MTTVIGKKRTAVLLAGALLLSFLPLAGCRTTPAQWGDTPRAPTYLKTLDKIFIQNDHRWTMYNAEAAHAALAADALLGYAA